MEMNLNEKPMNMNLEKLRELHERATPGPWHAHDSNRDSTTCLQCNMADIGEKDWELIAAMRNNIDKLLAVVEATQMLMNRLHTLDWARMDEKDQAPVCISHQNFKDLLYKYQQPVDAALAALEEDV